mmetsp:Transcript_22139/g.31640  ORF Transcript_22139/g.31640 Transcript_22139/m.31640 type:complete len:343 (-) Transcript_22139:224-1252(-)
MNSKEVPPESSSTNARRSRRNNDAAAQSDTARINRDFMNMFADLRLIDRLEASRHLSAIASVPSQTMRAALTETPDVPTPVDIMTPPSLLFAPRRRDLPPMRDPVEGTDIDDNASFGSLPALVQRGDSSDDDSSVDDSSIEDSSDEDSSDDEENEVMTYGSLPSLVTRSDSSDDEDDCSLPSLVSRSPSGEGTSFSPLLTRQNHHTVDNVVGRQFGGIRGIPLLLQSRHPLLRRRDSSDSDNGSDDDSNYSSDDSAETDGETYWEAVELEMETSNNHFDNEAIIDVNDSGVSSSQRRVNRFSGSSSVRRNFSRVRCRCLARVSNTQAWIALRDNMRVRRTVQ